MWRGLVNVHGRGNADRVIRRNPMPVVALVNFRFGGRVLNEKREIYNLLSAF